MIIDPFLVIAGILVIALAFNFFLAYKIFTFSRSHGTAIQEAQEKGFLIAKSRSTAEAVDAVTTREHNRESLRQAQAMFNEELSAYNPSKQEKKAEKEIMKDQEGNKYTVEDLS